MRSLRAAAVQMVSSTDPETNIATMKRLVREAAEQGADWVLLPEYWPLMGKNDTDKLAFAEPLDDGRVGKTCHTRFQTALSETGAHARRVDGRTAVCAEKMEEHRWSFAKLFDNMGVISRVVGYAFQSKSLVFDNVAAVSGECGLVLLKMPWLLKRMNALSGNMAALQCTSTREAATARTVPERPCVRKAMSLRRWTLRRVVVAKRADKPKPTGSVICPEMRPVRASATASGLPGATVADEPARRGRDMAGAVLPARGAGRRMAPSRVRLRRSTWRWT